MGRAQEMFDLATQEYQACIGLIQKMDDVTQMASDKKWDTRVTLAQFDMILQATLLSAALADGDFDRLEQQFVDKITDYGDLTNYIKTKTDGKLDISWAGIAALPSSTQQQLLELIPAILDELCNSFVGPLAILDKAMEDVDCLNFIVDKIGNILCLIAGLDGSAESREAQAGGRMIAELMITRWKSITD